MKANERNSRRIISRSIAMALVSILAFGCAGDYARQQAKRYYHQGQALVNRGETERAVKKFEKSMYLSEKTGFSAGIAHNLNELAIIHTHRKEYETARSELARALKIYRSLDMQPEASKTMNNIVQTYLGERRFEEAIEHYQMLIAWDEKTSNRLGMALSYRNMAFIYERQLGNLSKAREAYERYLEISQEPEVNQYLQHLQEK